jgi:hypothetical protein
VRVRLLLVAAISLVAAVAPGWPSTARAEHNFIINGTFDSALSPWSGENASVSGGVLRFTLFSTSNRGRAEQCIDTIGGTQYFVSGQARALMSTDVDVSILITVHNGAGCPGGFGFNESTATLAPTGSFQTFGTNVGAPPGETGSIRIRLEARRNMGSPDTIVEWDNIVVTAPNDGDGDGCSDGEEIQPNPLFGGDRDHAFKPDFFDLTGDQKIDLGDALEVLSKFGVGVNDPGYDADYDRYSPNDAKPWRTAFAIDGTGIDLSDALVSLISFGHDCSG